MLNQEEILKFKEDYQLRFGINFENSFDNPSEAIAKIQDADEMIESFIMNNCPKYSFWKATNRLDQFKQKAIWTAKLIQCNWVENVGDFTNAVGYDPVTNSYVTMNELEKRYISPKAIKILKQHGLLYSGLGCDVPNGIVPWI